MKNSKIMTTTTVLSGLFILALGAAYLFVPVAFYNSANQTDISGQVNLINEIRASGGVLFLSGLFIAAGAFYAKLRFTAFVLSILIWLGYGAARAYSVAMDGMPNEGLVTAMILELVFGAFFLFSLFRILKTKDNDKTIEAL